MALKCYTRQRNDGTKYINCKVNGNGTEKKSTKKNISNNKMPRSKTPPKRPAPPLPRFRTPTKTQSQLGVPVRAKSPPPRGGTPPRTKTQKLADAVPKGIPPEVLKTLPPAKTEKNKKFLGYVTSNKPIKIKQDANKRKQSLERYNKYKDAKTVVQMLKKGGTFYDLINDVEKGIITIGRPVVQAKVTLKPGMKLTKSKTQQQEMLNKGKVTVKKNKKNLLKKGEAI
jgi:hypothetical protein